MDTQKARREIGKWIVGVFTCCVLIFLGIRHVSSVVSAVGFLANLFSPLLIGIVLALIFNVPMRMFERLLRRKTKLKKTVRPLSILFTQRWWVRKSTCLPSGCWRQSQLAAPWVGRLGCCWAFPPPPLLMRC